MTDTEKQKEYRRINKKLKKLREYSASDLSDLLYAAVELLAVAEVRGDDELPHPADDDKLWTARMQSAWNDLREQVEFVEPDAIADEVATMKTIEQNQGI